MVCRLCWGRGSGHGKGLAKGLGSVGGGLQNKNSKPSRSSDQHSPPLCRLSELQRRQETQVHWDLVK